MGKKKTSMSLDEELWKEFLRYVISKTGSTHKVSAVLEEIIRDHLVKEGVLRES